MELIVIIVIIAFILGFLLSAALFMLGKIDTEDKMFELESKIARTQDYIDVIVRRDFEVPLLDVLITIQEILGEKNG